MIFKTGKDNTTIGLTFGAKLTIIFIIMKVFDVIGWSWLWIFSPLWIPIALLLGAIMLVWLYSILFQ